MAPSARSVFYQNGRTDRARFGHRTYSQLIPHLVRRGFGYLQNQGTFLWHSNFVPNSGHIKISPRHADVASLYDLSRCLFACLSALFRLSLSFRPYARFGAPCSAHCPKVEVLDPSLQTRTRTASVQVFPAHAKKRFSTDHANVIIVNKIL